MNDTLTTLDVITGVISHFQNIATNIQQSTQDWLDQVQKDLDEFGKAVAKGMAEYEKAEAEAFDILKRGGWLGMERHFTGPQVRNFLEISNIKGEAAANNAIIKYFAKDNWALLTSVSAEWLDVPYLEEPRGYCSRLTRSTTSRAVQFDHSRTASARGRTVCGDHGNVARKTKYSQGTGKELASPRARSLDGSLL
jgi:hypothetical protein